MLHNTGNQAPNAENDPSRDGALAVAEAMTVLAMLQLLNEDAGLAQNHYARAFVYCIVPHLNRLEQEGFDAFGAGLQSTVNDYEASIARREFRALGWLNRDDLLNQDFMLAAWLMSSANAHDTESCLRQHRTLLPLIAEAPLVAVFYMGRVRINLDEGIVLRDQAKDIRYGIRHELLSIAQSRDFSVQI